MLGRVLDVRLRSEALSLLLRRYLCESILGLVGHGRRTQSSRRDKRALAEELIL